LLLALSSLLALVHLLTSLSIDRHFKDLAEDFFPDCLLVLLEALFIIFALGRQLLHVLLDVVDVLSALCLLVEHGYFSQFDLVMACTLHIINALQNLGLGVFSLLAVSVVPRLVVLKQVFSVESLRFVGNLALFVVVEQEDLLLFHVELCLADLTLLFFIWAKAELLGHLLDGHILFHPVIK